MRKNWGKMVWFAVLVGAAVFAFAWAAQAAEFNWKQAQGTEIRFLALRAWFTDHWKAQLPEFEKLTGIKVVIEDYPEDPFRQKLAVEMSAKSKAVDVFSTGTMREGRQFYTSGWYADLMPLVNDPTATSTEWDRNDFIEAVWKALQFDGKQLAVPVQSNVQILFYRKDLFAAAGLKAPKTLEELEAAAKKLHNPPSVYGFVARGRKTQAPYTWSHWLYANGGSWLTPDGKPGINTPAGIAATQ